MASKKMAAKKDSKQAAAESHWLPVLHVQIAGALLEVVAECIAEGKTGMPLRKVLAMTNTRTAQAAWRKRLDKMLEGSGVL